MSYILNSKVKLVNKYIANNKSFNCLQGTSFQILGDICACGSSGSYRGHPGRCDSKVLCLEDKGIMFPRGIACSNGECRYSITGECSSNCSAEVCQQEVPIGMLNGVKFIQFILF